MRLLNNFFRASAKHYFLPTHLRLNILNSNHNLIEKFNPTHSGQKALKHKHTLYYKIKVIAVYKKNTYNAQYISSMFLSKINRIFDIAKILIRMNIQFKFSSNFVYFTYSGVII